MEHICAAKEVATSSGLRKIYSAARDQRAASGQEATFFPVAAFQAIQAAVGAETPNPEQLRAIHAGVICAAAGCEVDFNSRRAAIERVVEHLASWTKALVRC